MSNFYRRLKKYSTPLGDLTFALLQLKGSHEDQEIMINWNQMKISPSLSTLIINHNSKVDKRCCVLQWLSAHTTGGENEYVGGGKVCF